MTSQAVKILLLVLGFFALPGLVALLSTGAHASGSWYNVEVMVFAHERSSDEQWRRDRYPDYPTPHIRFSEQGTSLPADAHDALRAALGQGAWQSAGNLSLSDMRERMSSNGNYRILFHQSWRQPVGEREAMLPVYINGGRTLPGSQLMIDNDDQPDLLTLDHPELQGTLLLSESRFLHVEPNLWLALTDREGERYFASLSDTRRVRAGELHYIDNPRLGVLVKVSR